MKFPTNIKEMITGGRIHGLFVMNARDCVREQYLNGSHSVDEYKKTRHAIVCEASRLKLGKQEARNLLRDWNERCGKVLSPGEIKRQLYKYVDWVYKLTSSGIGCNGLESLCISKDKCLFLKKRRDEAKSYREKISLDITAARTYLIDNYPEYSRGYDLPPENRSRLYVRI